jgi:hypothetical protein
VIVTATTNSTAKNTKWGVRLDIVSPGGWKLRATVYWIPSSRIVLG